MTDEFDPPKPLPAQWDRQADFTDFESRNPATPKRGIDLDGEFDVAAQAIRETQFRLRMLQSDDGSLRNRIVGLDNLDASVLLGFEQPETWQPDTDYSDRASVFHDYKLYFANEAHTSGSSFTNDRDVNDYWELGYDFTEVVEDAIAARDEAEAFAEDSETARDQSRAARDESQDARDTAQELRDEVRDWLDMLVERSPTLYVAEYGDDSLPGTNPKQPLATLNEAMERAKDYEGVTTIFLQAGNYQVNNPVPMPPWTTVWGDSLRTTHIWAQNKAEDMFQMDNGCYLAEFAMRGLELDDTENPTKGFGAVLKPGAFITTSPYVQNCSAITNRDMKSLYKPLDADNANPAVGPGGGGMLCDPTVLDPYSPLNSMIVDAYTQVGFNGIGVLARKGGFVQMVSFFTNFSRYGCLAEDGGHIVLLNSNTTFGDYGLVADGSREYVVVDLTNQKPESQSPNAAALLEANKDFILAEMWERLVDNGDVPGWSTSLRDSTFKDGGILVDALAQSLANADVTLVERFVQGLFDWNGQHHIDPEYHAATLNSWAYLRDLARDAVVNAPISAMQNELAQSFDTDNPGTSDDRVALQNIMARVATNFESPTRETFGSLVVTTSHDFSYAGAGVNFLALPASQGGRGKTDMDKAVVQTNGGRVYYTAGDESGDFRIGDGMVIRQETGILEGRTFNRALFAQMTPFILALEGS